MYVHTHILKCLLQPFRRARKKRKIDGVDDPKSRMRQPSQPQSNRMAPDASASCKRFKMRSATSKTSRANFGSWGMSWTGNMPRSIRVLEIPMTHYDNHIASATRMSVIPSTSAQALSSFSDRSHPSEECRPRSSSFTRIASHTSRSASYRLRRILCFSNVRSRSVSYFYLELDTRAWVKKSHWTASAWTRQASRSTRTSLSVHAKAANPSSHVTTTPSQLSSSLSQARSCPCSSTATGHEGDRALHQSTSRSQR
jgi:hypothetical protein